MTSPRALLPVCLFLLCVSVLCAQPVTFSDGTFNSGDWTSATKIQDGTPGQNATCDASQATGGGNPDPYRRVTQTFTAGPVTCAHLRAGAVWDPRVRGPLTAIDYSYDLRDTAAFSVLVLQDSKYYQLRNQDNVATQGSWRRFNRLGVVAGDFVRVAGPESQPDFGPNASPLQFGFASNNSPSGPFDTIFHSSSSGIDNWQISLYSTLGSITYTDHTFLELTPPDWSAQAVPGLISGGSTFSAGSVGDSGFPPPSRHVTHSFGPGPIYVAHLRSGAVYDSLRQPALVAIDFSYDLMLRNGTPNEPVGYALLLLQGGNYYRSSAVDSASSSSWQHVSHTRLRATDFFLLTAGGPSNPRFDASAPPIQLGYVSFNDGAAGFSVRDSAIDNWSVTLYAVPDLGLSPSSLNFTYQIGGSPPPSKILSVESSGFPIDFIIDQPVSWLTLSALSGTTKATISVGINVGNLPPGNNASATITARPVGVPTNNGPRTVTVNVTVNSAPGFVQSVSPDNVTAGSPGASITVTGSGFGPGSTVLVNGLQIPTTVLNSTSLAAVIPPSLLTVSGLLQITVTGANGAVLFRVNQTGPVFTAVGIVSAASFQPGPLSPGEIISIFGSRLGPDIPAFLLVDPPGHVSNILGGVRVLFDGLPASVTYAQAGQVNAIVPYGVAGRAAVNLQIEYLGVRSDPVPMPVGPASPAIFTFAGGIGQGAILNQDFTINSAANPAALNSVIQIYGTGEGATNPPGQDGLIAKDVLPKPLLPVQVFIAGLAAEVTYSGGAPTLVAGVIQVNARIPSGVTPGPNVPIVIFVGTFRSQANVTVAVK